MSGVLPERCLKCQVFSHSDVTDFSLVPYRNINGRSFHQVPPYVEKYITFQCLFEVYLLYCIRMYCIVLRRIVPDSLSRDDPGRSVVVDNAYTSPAKLLTDLHKERAHLGEGAKHSGKSGVSLSPPQNMACDNAATVIQILLQILRDVS